MANTNTDNGATRSDVLEWRDSVTDPTLRATLPKSGGRGRLHPNLVAAFESATGKTFNGYTTGKVARTVDLTMRKRNNRPATLTVTKAEVREVATSLGLIAERDNKRGRLPKGVYADKRILAELGSREDRNLIPPKGATETVGVESTDESSNSDSE